MIRLLTFCLVSAAIRVQVASSYQTGPSGGEGSPFYNLLTSSLLSKCPTLNSTSDQPPLTCTCGFYSQQPPSAPPSGQLRPPLFSGVMVFPSSELQQVLRAPVPVPLYAPSPHHPPSPEPDTPPSYIMTIPKKYSPDAPSPNTFQEPFYPPPYKNPIFYSPPPPPPPPPTSPPPRPFYYTPRTPLMSSCPAMVYFPSTQAMSFNQPSGYPSAPCPPGNPSSPSHPPGPIVSPPPFSKSSLPNPQVAVPPPRSFPTSPSAGTKEPLITYTLRTSAPPDVFPGTSLEAESKDCSMPTPPVLV